MEADSKSVYKNGYLIEPCDILFCYQGSIGRMLLVDEVGLPVMPTAGICILRLRLGEKKKPHIQTLSKILYLYLGSRTFLDQLKPLIKKKDGVRRINLQDLMAKTRVPVNAFTGFQMDWAARVYKVLYSLHILGEMAREEVDRLKDWTGFAIPRAGSMEKFEDVFRDILLIDGDDISRNSAERTAADYFKRKKKNIFVEMDRREWDEEKMEWKPLKQ